MFLASPAVILYGPILNIPSSINKLTHAEYQVLKLN